MFLLSKLRPNDGMPVPTVCVLSHMTFIGKNFQQRGPQLRLEKFVGSAVFIDYVEKLDSLY
jgi:hypothetical protein